MELKKRIIKNTVLEHSYINLDINKSTQENNETFEMWIWNEKLKITWKNEV